MNVFCLIISLHLLCAKETVAAEACSNRSPDAYLPEVTRPSRVAVHLSVGVQIAALPPLGFSPKILGFSIQSWVLGFF